MKKVIIKIKVILIFLCFFIIESIGNCATSEVNLWNLPLGKALNKTAMTSSNSTLDKKFKVIVFLSARCPCSNSHTSELNELAELYSQFDFIGVHSNSNETEVEAKEYFVKNNFKFPIIQDQHTRIADGFKAFKTPHVFVINQKSEIIYQGGVSSSNMFKKDSVKPYLREVLEDLSQGKVSRHQQTRSLGCVILRENEVTQ